MSPTSATNTATVAPSANRADTNNQPNQQRRHTMNTYKNEQGDIVCSIHMDLSVMNAHDECDECLDDAHEAEILAR